MSVAFPRSGYWTNRVGWVPRLFTLTTQVTQILRNSGLRQGFLLKNHDTVNSVRVSTYQSMQDFVLLDPGDSLMDAFFGFYQGDVFAQAVAGTPQLSVSEFVASDAAALSR